MHDPQPPVLDGALARTVLLLAGLWSLLVPCAVLGWFVPAMGMALVAALVLVVLLVLACLARGVAIGLQGALPPGRAWSATAWSIGVAGVLGPVLLAGGSVHPPRPALGWDDQGTHALSAIHLARTGSYGIAAPLLAETPGHLRHLLTIDRRAMALAGDEHAPLGMEYLFGFFRDRTHPDRLFPVFPPGFPVLLASGFQLVGWDGMGGTQALLVLLGAGAAALLALRWHGPLAAGGTWLIALCNPLMLWAANTLYAEPAVAALWLLALCCLESSGSGGARARLATVLAMTTTLAIKVDGLPLALAALTVALGAGGRRQVARLAAVAGLGTLVALAVWIRCHGEYIAGTVVALASGPGRVGLAAIAVAGVIGALFLPGAGAIAKPLARWVGPARAAGIVAIVLLAAYAYLVRPGPALPDRFHFWPAGGLIRSYREDTFLRLGWYLHPLGLCMAIAGVCALLWRARTLAQGLCLLLGASTLLAFGYDLLNNPVQPYAMRRFLPFALPLLVIGMGSWWVVAGRWRWPCLALGIASPLMLCVLTQRLASPWFSAANMGGLPAQLDALVQALPARSVVILERGAGLDDLGPYLHLVGGRRVAMRDRVDPLQADAWRDAIAAWRAGGAEVFLMSPVRSPRGWDGEALEARRAGIITYRGLLSRADRLPDRQERTVRAYHLFALRAANADTEGGVTGDPAPP